MRDINQGPCFINDSIIIEKPKQTNVNVTDISSQKSNGLGGGQGKKSEFITRIGRWILSLFTKKTSYLSEIK